MHPRAGSKDPHNPGKFAPKGQGGSSKILSTKEIRSAVIAKHPEYSQQLAEIVQEHAIRQRHPALINVGGDDWNRRTAARLARTYEGDIHKLDALYENIFKGGEAEKIANEPHTWEDLSSDTQEEIKQHFINNHFDDYKQSEIDNWHESGDAASDAAYDLIHNDKTWLTDAIVEFKEQFPDVPFDENQLYMSLRDTVDVDDDYEWSSFDKDDPPLKVKFDDSKLEWPTNVDKHQLDLPEMGAANYAAALTSQMREDLTAILKTKFGEAIDTKQWDMEPPDYLNESVHEQLEDAWDQEEDKFAWAKNNTDLLDKADDHDDYGEESSFSKWNGEPPKHLDPLNENSDNDYYGTQFVAKQMSIQRAQEILNERNINAKDWDGNDVEINSDRIWEADKNLWEDWKGSSSSNGGLALQIAIAQELGGRLNTKYISRTSSVQSVIDDANRVYKAIGGFEGVKALVRAKWETTQYMLDKAGIDEVNVYRSVNINGADQENVEEINLPSEEYTYAHKNQFLKFTDLNVHRNGAISTTMDPKVANDWGSSWDRVILRIKAPRTAVISVPAYGINVHHERELVLAGTAWTGWDAWKAYAPTFDDVPMKIEKTKAEEYPVPAGEYPWPGPPTDNQAIIEKIKADLNAKQSYEKLEKSLLE